jgi:hypothetical protein
MVRERVGKEEEEGGRRVEEDRPVVLEEGKGWK